LVITTKLTKHTNGFLCETKTDFSCSLIVRIIETVIDHATS